jgi:hypothetical protein
VRGEASAINIATITKASITCQVRNAVRLEQNLHEGVLVCPPPRSGMRDPMLAHFDLAELQARDGAPRILIYLALLSFERSRLADRKEYRRGLRP